MALSCWYQKTSRFRGHFLIMHKRTCVPEYRIAWGYRDSASGFMRRWSTSRWKKMTGREEGRVVAQTTLLYNRWILNLTVWAFGITYFYSLEFENLLKCWFFYTLRKDNKLQFYWNFHFQHCIWNNLVLKFLLLYILKNNYTSIFY